MNKSKKKVHRTIDTSEEIKNLRLDHFGIIAAICKELRIKERINARIKNHKLKVLTCGDAVVSMILNGLGFVNRRLYLHSQFFENKPVDLLLDADIKAEDITDATLAKALDAIYQYGTTKLFAEIIFEIAVEHNLLDRRIKIDTTSISVEGAYEKTNEDPRTLKITYGHSKDKRPDLKQFLLTTVTSGLNSMPFWFEALNGNSSDKKSFPKTVEMIENFKKNLHLEGDWNYCMDAAFYTEENVRKANYSFTSRVPGTIEEAKQLLLKDMPEWEYEQPGYKVHSTTSFYGGKEQLWFLVLSEQGYLRDKKALERKIETQKTALEKELKPLMRETFQCHNDAFKSFRKIEKKFSFFNLKANTVEDLKYQSPGKPKKGAEKTLTGYKLQVDYQKNEEHIASEMKKAGKFIISTNELNTKHSEILPNYKGLQYAEMGNRFLKDPTFMLSSIFLKLPRRIDALMMVMTLTAFVYHFAEKRLRDALKEKNETVPNQVKKRIKNPTLRSIFIAFEGIDIRKTFSQKTKKLKKEVVTNINELKARIISYFGHYALVVYGLVPDS